MEAADETRELLDKSLLNCALGVAKDKTVLVRDSLRRRYPLLERDERPERATRAPVR
jgi:hypothetical protein